MFIRLALAAAVSFAAVAPAMAAGSDGKVTIWLSRTGDAAADAAHASGLIQFKAQEACRFGAKLADRACVKAFVADAVDAVKSERLRTALAGEVQARTAFD